MNTSFFPRANRLLAPALAMGLSLAAAGAAENEVVVISPHWDGIKEETSRAFRDC